MISTSRSTMKNKVTNATIIFCVFCLARTQIQPDKLVTLRLVQILTRHGDRSPSDPFPTDIHKEYWKDGYGQLTNIGKKQQYDLGSYIRNRYDGFLQTNYHRDEILVNSTKFDRTMMSAACFVAGLYTPSGEQVWNPDIMWQPVPIYTRPLATDYIFGAAVCPAQRNSKSQQAITDERLTRNKDLLDLINKETGANIASLSGIVRIYDTLFCELCHNLSWPSWVAPVWPRILDIVNSNSDRENSSLAKRLNGGLLLGHLIDNMYFSINGDEEQRKRKLYLYSGHDTTIINFLNVLDLHNNILPPYNSAVLVELHYLESGQYAVQIAYKNMTGSVEPYVLTIPGCTDLCPFDQLVNLTSDWIPGDILEECQVTPVILNSFFENTMRRFKH